MIYKQQPQQPQQQQQQQTTRQHQQGQQDRQQQHQQRQGAQQQWGRRLNHVDLHCFQHASQGGSTMRTGA